MSTLLRKLAPIQSALTEFEKAEERLKGIVADCQSECPHELVLQYIARGEDMRLCPKCGLEEHAPVYHDFAFDVLTAADRVLVPSDDSMFKHRVHTSEIRHPLK